MVVGAVPATPASVRLSGGRRPETTPGGRSRPGLLDLPAELLGEIIKTLAPVDLGALSIAVDQGAGRRDRPFSTWAALDAEIRGAWRSYLVDVGLAPQRADSGSLEGIFRLWEAEGHRIRARIAAVIASPRAQEMGFRDTRAFARTVERLVEAAGTGGAAVVELDLSSYGATLEPAVLAHLLGHLPRLKSLTLPPSMSPADLAGLARLLAAQPALEQLTWTLVTTHACDAEVRAFLSGIRDVHITTRILSG